MLWCALHHHIPAFKPPRRQICSGPISLPVVITRCLRLRPIQHSIRNWHQWITTVSFQSGPINPGLQLLRHLTFCLSRIFNSFGVTPQPFSIGPTDFSCSAKHRIRMFACKQKRTFARPRFKGGAWHPVKSRQSTNVRKTLISGEIEKGMFTFRLFLSQLVWASSSTPYPTASTRPPLPPKLEELPVSTPSQQLVSFI